MTRILMMCCAAAAMLAGAVSCEEPETGYEGINYIYLEANSSYMYDVENVSFELTARLTTTLEEDLSLSFKVMDDNNNLISFENNPITIPAGELTGTVAITAGTLPAETESVIVKIAIDESAGLPENVKVSGNFNLTIRSSAMTDLTDDQLAIVSAYSAATGIDLTKYIGIVKVSTRYTAPNEDGGPMPDEILNGETEIILSDESTVDQPVLKMSFNPMGIQDKMLAKLKASTVDYYIWTDPDTYESYTTLMTEVPWTENETFSMSLDGIKPMTDGTVEFTADITEIQYDEEVTLTKVPFEYKFSLYEKEKQALADGSIGTAVDEYWMEDATYNPSYQLNYEDISETVAIDEYEASNWIKASATISNEELVFTFSMMNYIDYDYTKVVATYTPNE